VRQARLNNFKIVVAAKIVRTFGYGLLSVALALYLAARGLSPFAIGAALTVALLAGAASTASSGLLIPRLGSRGTLLTASIALLAAGVVLGIPGAPPLIFVACLIGAISAGGQEVGPFIAVEQLIVAESEAAGGGARAFAVYNFCGALALALGALAAAAISIAWIPIVYAGCGALLFLIYSAFGHLSVAKIAPPRSPRVSNFGPAESLAAMFGLDALAGGFVVQSFIAYWFHLRFGADQRTLGLLFFGANTLAAFSYAAAAWLSTRIGYLRTMVFTHLPSNVLLCLIPLAPTFGPAAALLLARFALSQMDVPTRQAFTMLAVPPQERAHAAALTNAVRPAAAAVAPIFAGLAVQTAAFGLPFYVAGALKIVYDLVLFAAFKNVER
jgi:MFS family permease